jgi:hypothetical protein
MTSNEFIVNVDFKKEILHGNLQLIIYYNSDKDTLIGASPDLFRRGIYDYKTIVNSSILYNYLNDIEELNGKYVKNLDKEHAIMLGNFMRVFCEFKIKDGGTLLDFTYDNDDYMLINNICVKNEKRLFKFIEDFLPASIVPTYSLTEE